MALADVHSDWKEREIEAQAVTKCENDKRLAGFLQQAAADLPLAGRSEGNLEVIDNIILSNPSCFLRALDLLTRDQREVILNRFVGTSDMHDQSQIDGALRSVSGSPAKEL
jgi:hypothetical protein